MRTLPLQAPRVKPSRAISIDSRGFCTVESLDMGAVIEACTLLMTDCRLSDETLSELSEIRASRLACFNLN